MAPDAMDEFECELRQVLERIPAPPGLKRRVIERRDARHAARRRSAMWWRRLVAAAALLCVLAGAWFWRGARQRREGVQARRQVILALRITNRALAQMQSQLAAHNRKVPDRQPNEME